MSWERFLLTLFFEKKQKRRGKKMTIDLTDEKQLVSQLRDEKTQRSAFERVVRMHSEQLYWLIRKFVVNHEDANDILQNTFIKAWTNIGSFRGESKISTWLHKIAYNESLSFLNKKREQLSIDNDEGIFASNLESDPYFDGDETQRQLQEAISTLPEKQRLVFTMKYMEDMKYEDIAEITGTSVGALKASYHIAVEKISLYFNKVD